MEILQMPVGPVQANCYVIWNTDGDALIVDPGAEGDKINQVIKEKQLKPVAILLTHAHFDHIAGLETVVNEWNIPIYLHKEEKDWLKDPALNGSSFFPMVDDVAINEEADHILSGEQMLKIGAFSLQVLETPGHSPGSVSYYIKEEGVVFSGDALFNGSIGRTDLPGGNQEVLLNSIHEKLLTLPEDTRVFSGHGPETTIQAEMDMNPFLSGF